MQSKTIFRHRRAILIVSLLVTAGGAIFGFGAIGNLATAGFVADNSESYKIAKLFDKTFVDSDPDYYAILEHEHWLVDDQEFRDGFEQLKVVLSKLPVHSILSPFDYPTTADSLISNDRTKAMITFRQNQDKPIMKHEHLDAAVEHGDVSLKVTFSGAELVNEEVSATILVDLARAESFTLPIVIAFMVLAFQGVVAFLPALAVAFFTIVWSLVVIRLVNYGTDMSEFAVNAITLMGLGVSVDYSLFVVLRFQEERTKFPTHDLSILMDRVLATSGRTVFFSAVTVALSLTGTFFFNEYYIYSMGFAIILVVCFAALATLTILPAILFTLDKKIFVWSTRDIYNGCVQCFQKCCSKNSEPKSTDATEQREWQLSDGRWYRITIFCMRFALPLCVIIFAGLGGLLYVFFSEAQLASPTPLTLPKGSNNRYAYEVTQHDFDAAGQTTNKVYLRTINKLGVWDPEFLLQMQEFATNLEAIENVASVSCLVRFGLGDNITAYLAAYEPFQTNPDMHSPLRDPFYLTNMENIAVVEINIGREQFSSQAKRVLTKSRQLLDRSFFNSDGSRSIEEWGITGASALNHDMFDDVFEQLPKWLAVMIVSIYVLILAMTGSVFLPLKAISVAILSLSASLGVLVLVFQRGNGEDVLEFTATGHIDGLQLIFIFSLAFGLSMDYELFIIGRVLEIHNRVPNTKIAVASGLQGTARAVTMAAIVLAIVMAAFISSRTGILKLIGLGVAFSIVVDATIVRIVLVPGMMQLLGPLNWWAPAFIKRIVAVLNLKEKTFDDDPPESAEAASSNQFQNNVQSTETLDNL
eukprot:c8234_g1_i1.p1 GENE.c8234_g1_i1~~c8234_g1_i1.p1  ORF type:complete len:835 (+),score=205.51 c8234_g1_i1:71-2506(+)